jgi:hypothetical protein
MTAPEPRRRVAARLCRFAYCLTLAGVLALVGGCSGPPASDAASATPSSAREVPLQTLGFLDDYSKLAPGREGQARLIFIDVDADFSAFSMIFIEPVVPWPAEDGDATEATRELAVRFDAALREELAKEFALVDRPRANALQLRTALAARNDDQLILELELLDAGSGRRLVAVVDSRDHGASGNEPRGDERVPGWASLIRDRLATFRQFDAATRDREPEDGD